MSKWLVIIVVLVLIPLVQAAPSREQRDVSQVRLASSQTSKRVALVIGNGDYQHTRRLANPANDADDIARALKGFGFEVVALKDGTRRQMKEKLADFSRRIDGASAALVYYAGHGAQLRGENYLIPVDAGVDTEATIIDESISLNRVLDELDGARNRINIVMLDACRDNPVSGKFRTLGRGLIAPTSTPKGTVIVYATEPGNVAADGEGRNSPFTAGLIKAFQGQDLTLDGVLTVASAEVERATENRQVPYVNGPKTAQKAFRFAVTLEPSPGEIERDFWASIKDSSDPADFDEYLKVYPNGNFRGLAENRLRRLRNQAAGTSPRVDGVSPNTAILNQAMTFQVSGSDLPVTLAFAIQDAECNKIGASQFQCVPRSKGDKSVVVKNRPGGSVMYSTRLTISAPIGVVSAYEPQMVPIPAGCFQMGSPEHESGRDKSEGPQRQVCIKAFEIGKYEVTFSEWDACVADGGCGQVRDQWGRGKLPVINVGWDDAQAYVKWLSRKTGKAYRLPSESEWEYAARAGTTGPFSLPGPITVAKVNLSSDGPVSVGTLPANPWGLHEVHGNVAEWVVDCWHGNYVDAPIDGHAWGEENGGNCARRVVRGGHWKWKWVTEDVRSSVRTTLIDFTDSRVGFRVAQDVVGVSIP